MMISVIGRAMIATSMRAAIRFAKLPGVRKNGDRALPSTISPSERDDEQRLPAREEAGPGSAGRARASRWRSSAAVQRGGPLEPSEDDRVRADRDAG